GKTVLQKPRTVDRKMIHDDPVYQQVHRMAKGLVAVPSEKIASDRAIEAVIEIVHLIKNAIAKPGDRGLFVDEIVSRSGARLELLQDLQRHAVVVGRKSPVIEMP